jgi:hypothetical protein
MNAPAEGPRRIQELVDEITNDLHLAQREIAALQGKTVDSWLHRQLDAISDRIFNALAKLGD